MTQSRRPLRAFPVIAASVALTAAGVAAPSAAADVKFRGKTSQGRDVVLRTSDSGKPELVSVVWRAPCTPRGGFRTRTFFKPPFDRSSTSRIFDAGPYRFRDREHRYRLHSWLRARKTSKRRWQGSFGGRVTVRRDGRVIARCKSGRITWSARRGGS